MKTSLCLAGPALVLLWAAAGAQEDAKKDFARMQGTWVAKVVEASGKPIPVQDQARINIKLVVNGNTYKVYRDEKPIESGVMSLDPNQKPKNINAFPLEGLDKGKAHPDKGKFQPGIYHFIGEEMHVVFTNPDKARPSEFKTRPGSDEIYVSYKRLKATK